MLGDHQEQNQKQTVKQEVNLHGQEKIEISCDYYTNRQIESLENAIRDQIITKGQPDASDMMALKDAQKVNILQFQGNVKKVFCSLLVEGGKCSSPNNSGKRCYLLGYAPAVASSTPRKGPRIDWDGY